jgi:UDP-2,3-diacylglucosamine pyrophosphatase LpxH
MREARTVWISDIHLGTDICQHDKLLDFLKSFESKDGKSYNLDTLYLVGDIIDMVQMNHRIFWSQHRTVIKKFIRMADKGVKVIYIRGNHDWFLEPEFLSDSPQGVNFNGISIKMNDVYHTLNGEKMLILHGDEFDGVIKAYLWLYALGDFAYNVLIFISKIQNTVRRLFRVKEWSLSLYVKTEVKGSIQFINNFEQLVVDEAKRKNVDIVLAGHIHKAQDSMIDGVRYLNCGTWTEFCSAVIEGLDGTIQVQVYD